MPGGGAGMPGGGGGKTISVSLKTKTQETKRARAVYHTAARNCILRRRLNCVDSRVWFFRVAVIALCVAGRQGDVGT